jgi:hypothetical protein
MNEYAIQARQFVLMSYSKYSSRVLYGEKAIGVLILFNTYKEREAGRVRHQTTQHTARCITSALSRGHSDLTLLAYYGAYDMLVRMYWRHCAGQLDSPYRR